jgi:hypothetical protein
MPQKIATGCRIRRLPNPLLRDRWFADSPLEEAGFEPSVPGYGEFGRI